MGKAARLRKRRRHAMSAVKGNRPTTRAGRAAVAKVEPTPEMKRRLREQGPTCRIQWAVKQELLTPLQAQAVEQFAGLRRMIGVAEYQAPGILARQQPADARFPMDEERAERALSAYRHACDALNTVPGSHAELSTLCDQRTPGCWVTVIAGAQVLERLFIQGEKAA